MVWGKTLGLALALLGIPAVITGNTASAADCGRGWVYFDLGNTLVDSHDPSRTHYLPGAPEYVVELQRAGFHLGLITNIPQSWGQDTAQKVARLKQEIAATWDGPQPFDWSPFEIFLVPLADAERKPAPVLFERALAAAGECRTAYEGDDPLETQAAERAGFSQTYVVGVNADAFYAPIDQLLVTGSGRYSR